MNLKTRKREFLARCFPRVHWSRWLFGMEVDRDRVVSRTARVTDLVLNFYLGPFSLAIYCTILNRLRKRTRRKT
jgi:hypothetical protein